MGEVETAKIDWEGVAYARTMGEYGKDPYKALSDFEFDKTVEEFCQQYSEEEQKEIISGMREMLNQNTMNWDGDSLKLMEKQIDDFEKKVAENSVGDEDGD